MLCRKHAVHIVIQYEDTGEITYMNQTQLDVCTPEGLTSQEEHFIFSMPKSLNCGIKR